MAREHRSSLADPDEGPVFWLAVADTAWRLGRPQEHATAEAIRIIETGADLHRWDAPEDRRKREAVLRRLATSLRSPPPPPVRVPKRFIGKNAWEVGEIVAYRLGSGSWTAFRVIGHHVDKGGRHAVCEPLDGIGPQPPNQTQLHDLGCRRSIPPWKVTQFMLSEPRQRKDLSRLVQTGVRSTPTQPLRGYMCFVFPHVDRQLKEIFGLE